MDKYMSIWTPPGEQVRFIKYEAGWDNGILAKDCKLVLGTEYTISKIRVESCMTYVYLEGVKDESGNSHGFSSSHFENVTALDPKIAEARERAWICGRKTNRASKLEDLDDFEKELLQ